MHTTHTCAPSVSGLCAVQRGGRYEHGRREVWRSSPAWPSEVEAPSEGVAVVAAAAGEARSPGSFPWHGVGHEPARRSVLVMQGVEARS